MQLQEKRFLVFLWVMLMVANVLGIIVAVGMALLWPASNIVARSGYPTWMFYLIMTLLLVASLSVVIAHKHKNGLAYWFSLAFVAIHLAGNLIVIAIEQPPVAELLQKLVFPVLLLAVISWALYYRKAVRAVL